MSDANAKANANANTYANAKAGPWLSLVGPCNKILLSHQITHLLSLSFLNTVFRRHSSL